MADFKEYEQTEADQELVSFVVSHITKWRDHRDTNYLDRWDEYERLWRGIWDSADKMRDSERSRIVTPALQQAIESKHAEISSSVWPCRYSMTPPSDQPTCILFRISSL